MNVGIRRENYPGEVPVKWPTPLAVFLRQAQWIPVKRPDEPEPIRVSASIAWSFDDDQAETPPLFAPLIPRTLRRRIERNVEARRTLRWCGVRWWGDPLDAPDLVHVLYELLRDDRALQSQIALFRRQYEQAIEHSLDQGTNPWADCTDLDLVVQRGPRLETWSSDSTSETIYINDGAEPVKSKIIGDSSAPVVCVRTAEGARLASLLSPLLEDRLRLLSEVDVEITVDGSPVLDIPSLLLIEPSREWLVTLVVAALDFKGSEFRRQTEHALREKARRLRDVMVVPAVDLTISVDGQTSLDPTLFDGAFGVVNENRPLIVVQDYPGDFTWAVLERLANPLAQVIRAAEIGPIIFQALVHLERSLGTDMPDLPTEDDLARVLGIKPAQVMEVAQLLQSSFEMLAERLHVVLACLVSPAVATEMLPRLSQATSEDALVAALRDLSLDAEKLLQATKSVSTLRELRDELRLGYRQFNDALIGLGRSPLINPSGQNQAFQYFFRRNREGIMARLRDAFMPSFVAGEDVAAYADLRKLTALQAPDAWLEECEIPTDEMMAAEVNRWLSSVGAFGLPDHPVCPAGYNYTYSQPDIRRDCWRVWCSRCSGLVPDARVRLPGHLANAGCRISTS